MSNPIVLIPARLRSSRLPDKPLADIAGLPMIVHVLKRAQEADVGPVFVACADAEIHDTVASHGGRAIMTNPELPSGTDRIFAALNVADPSGVYDQVVNLQGDLPTLEPEAIRSVLEPLEYLNTDMSTLINETHDEKEANDPNVVKAVVSFTDQSTRLGRALYFTRARAPSGPGPVMHHIGIYGFQRPSLLRYANLPPSPLELRERLEQLRALENGMSIGACRVDSVPFGVDTPEDLERARDLLA